MDEGNLISIATELADPEQIEALERYQRDHVPEFLERLERHPLRVHRPGYVSLGEAFWLYRMVRDLQPLTVIESGTMDGYSAWWLWQGLSKNGLLLTYDPADVPDKLRKCVQSCPSERLSWKHITSDITNANGPDAIFTGRIPVKPFLAFFDDHQDQTERLRLCAQANISHVILHDVTPTGELWRHGLGLQARVFQFPVIREPYIFRLAHHSHNRWLTYVQLQPPGQG